jgi:hypothetical protein
MARQSFDFDSVKIADGGFYHTDGDAQGTMLVAWGRRGRNKWVQLSQTEIGNFLAHGHEMLRTDDATVKLLTDLARALAAAKPVTFEDVLNDPDGLGKRYFDLAATGLDRDTILKQLTADQAA